MLVLSTTVFLRFLGVPQVSQFSRESNEVSHAEDTNNHLFHWSEASFVDVVLLVLEQPILKTRPPRVARSNVFLVNMTRQVSHLKKKKKKNVLAKYWRLAFEYLEADPSAQLHIFLS